jgi:hypothetical protein
MRRSEPGRRARVLRSVTMLERLWDRGARSRPAHLRFFPKAGSHCSGFSHRLADVSSKSSFLLMTALAGRLRLALDAAAGPSLKLSRLAITRQRSDIPKTRPTPATQYLRYLSSDSRHSKWTNPAPRVGIAGCRTGRSDSPPRVLAYWRTRQSTPLSFVLPGSSPLSGLGSLLGGVQRWLFVRKRGLFGIVGMERTARACLVPLHHCKNRRQNDQRRDGGAEEAADNRAAERSG